MIGKASSAAAVTVNGGSTSRLDEYFHKEVTTTNTGKIHIPYSATATDGSGTTNHDSGKFLSATPEVFGHDFDGNLISDGRFNYTWDAENRLIAMETHATVPLPARRKLTFAYDFMGRRIRKTVWHGTSGGGWQLHHKFDFIHELGGWNILAERSGGSNNSFLRTYTWGTDLSGNLSGAGGVGGLLSTKFHTSNTTVANGMDLNGNVTLLVNKATGQSAATYDYGPFGEPLRQSGEYATLNPFRFSTKYTDNETGFVDYGYRPYIPSLGRWPSRDPIEEKGGVNLYGFVDNDGVNHWDYLGLDFIAVGKTTWRPSIFGFSFNANNHAIIQYWKTQCKLNAEDLNQWTTAKELSLKLTRGSRDDAVKLEKSVELTPYTGSGAKGYSSTATFSDIFVGDSGFGGISNVTIQKKYTNLWISYIKRELNEGEKIAPVYYGSEVSEKWESIDGNSKSYQYAEQSAGSLSLFPQSIYGSPAYSQPTTHGPVPFNNSNTFARHMLNQAGIDWKIITRSDFLGNSAPVRVGGAWTSPTSN